MISCPEAAASIRGVNPEPGSLSATKRSIKKSDWNDGVLGTYWETPLTLHWHRHCCPKGTWPFAGGPCLCSETERSILGSLSAPNQHLAVRISKDGLFKLTPTVSLLWWCKMCYFKLVKHFPLRFLNTPTEHSINLFGTCSRKYAILSFPQLAANIKGVTPLAVVAFTFTPASSKRFAMLSCPI